MEENTKTLFSRFYVIRENVVVVEGCLFSTNKVSCIILESDTTITYPSLDMLYFDFNKSLGYNIVFLDKAAPESKEDQKPN